MSSRSLAIMAAGVTFALSSANAQLTTNSFGPFVSFNVSSLQESAATGDLDGDGKADIATVNYSAGTISVLRNVGAAGSAISSNSFLPKVDFPAGGTPRAIALADIDGDGKLDILVANDQGTLAVLRNTSTSGNLGTNAFAAPVLFSVAGGNAYSLAVGDLDGDGRLDVAVTSAAASAISVFRNSGSAGVTSNSFSPRVDFPVGSTPFGTSIGDVDGDGRPDLVVANYNSGTVSILKNTSVTGSLTTNSFARKVDFVVTGNPTTPGLADLDGNGKLDLVVANYGSGKLSVFRNIGTNGVIATNSATFAPRVDYDAGGGAYAVAIADYDGDGRLDVAIANAGLHAASVFWNRGSGILTGRVDYAVGGDARYVVAGDLNGDGRPDLIATKTSGSAISVLQNLPITAPVITQQPVSVTVTEGQAASFTVQATGTQPLGYQWRFGSNNILGATSTNLTLSNVQLSQAGSYSVVVVNGAGSVISSNAVLTVNPFIVSTNCTPAPAGLVSMWKGEGNALDSVNGNNGTIVDGLAYASGKVGQSFLYTNSSGHVKIPASSSLNVGAGGAMTVEGWINPSEINDHYPIWEWNNGLGGPGSTFGEGVSLFLSIVSSAGTGPGSLFVSYMDANGSPHQVSTPAGTITANAFQHVAMTYDKASGQAFVYVNGSPVLQQSIGSFTPQTSYDFYLGYRPTSENLHFKGRLDEVSIYNRALGSSEISAIFSAGSAGKCAPQPVAPVISQQPLSQTTTQGQTVTLSIQSSGTPPLTYQWRYEALNIVGATNSSLVLSNVQPSQSGNYSAVVANGVGTTTSSNALLTVNAPPQCYPAPAGLVSWWKAESNALDSVSGNNGNPVGVVYAPGEVGQAFDLHAFLNYITVPANPTLDVGTGNGFTIEVWANPNSATATLPLLEWGLVTNNTIGLQFWLSSYGTGNLFANLRDVSGVDHIIISPDNVIAAHEFQHLALTFDKASGIAKLFRNGVQLASTNFGPIIPRTDGPLAIAGRINRPISVQSFTGYMDEISVYNRALTSSELTGIYASSTAGKCPPTTIAPFIIQQPSNQVATVGQTVYFTAVAGGTQPLSYQWRFGSNNLAGATNISLIFSNVQLSQAGNYSLLVANDAGTATSFNASLTVNPVIPPATNCIPAPVGLVSMWKAEGNTSDSVDGNSGTIVGGLGYAPGEVGQGFLYITNGGYIKIPASSTLNVGAGGAMTVEGWINPSEINDHYPIWEWNNGLGTPGSTYGEGVSLFLSIVSSAGTGPGSLFVSYIDTNGVAHQVSTPAGTITTNIFQHVAMTYDRSTTQAVVYVNGNPVLQQNIGSFTPQTSYDFYLGYRPTSENLHFKGRLDEVSIYNRALGSSEISAIYNAGSFGKCTPAPVAPAITQQPTNQTVTAGQNVVFAVRAVGTQPLTYQWRFGSNNIVGANTSSLVLSNVQPSQAGSYNVVVANAVDSVTSADAQLTVNPVIVATNCIPAPAGLVSMWKAEGNTSDSVDGNNGTVIGGIGYAPGEVGQGFLYITNGGYVKVPASTALNVGAGGAMTVEGWINPSEISDHYPIVEWNNGLGGPGSPFGEGVTLWLSIFSGGGTGSGSLFSSIMDTNGVVHQINTPAGTITTNVFQHVALTYDRATGLAALYVNGAQVLQQNVGNFTPQTSYDFYLGYRPTSENLHFKGRLDEVSIYNRALGSSEIGAIYNAGSFGKCTPAPVAPAITQQPASQTITAGQNATFAVQATGTQPLTYQWRFGSNNILGATKSSLVLSNVQVSQAGSYNVVVANTVGSVTSANAQLTVNPVIVATNCIPAPAGLVSMWKGESNTLDSVDGNNGTAFGSLGYAAGEVGRAFSYNGLSSYVRVPASSNLNVGAGGGFTLEAWINPSSSTATLPLLEWGSYASGTVGVQFWLSSYGTANLFANIYDAAGTDHIFVSPNNVIAPNQFQHVALTFDKASGTAKLFRNGVELVSTNLGAPFTPKTVAELYLGKRNGGQTFSGLLDEASIYRRALAPNEILAIYNAGAAGKCYTPPATAPSITQQPVNQSVFQGQTVGFSVQATGTQPLTYQWRFGPGDISGATNSSLLLSNVQPNQAGSYSVVVANIAGSATSSNAHLAVASLPVVDATLVWTNGHTYYLLGPSTWTEAEAFAVSLGGHLVTINDQAEDAWVFSQFGTNSLWIGLNDAASEGNFTWTSGEPVSYTNWRSGEPNNGNGDEDYAYIHPAGFEGAGTWNDSQNDGNYIAPEPPPRGLVETVSACIPAPAGLVSLWKGDGNTLDSADGNNGATVGALAYAGGKVGQAFAFNGSNAQVRISASQNLNVGAGEGITIETWINPSDIQNWHPLVEWNNASGSSTGEGAHFWLSSSTSSSVLPGALYANLQDANANQAHLIGTPAGVIQTGTWQHVALTYDKASGIARIYRNGAVVAQQNLGSFSPRTGTNYDLYLGFRATPGFPIRYAGLMDEVGLYSRALSANEIAAVYSGNSNGKCAPVPPTCVPAPVGLVSTWKGEGSALDAVDGNNGLIIGTMAYANAKVAQGFSYTGTANYVRVPASSNLNVGAAVGFTLEGWINPSSAPSQMPIFEWSGSNGVGLQFWTSSYGTANLFANIIDSGGVDHLFYSTNGVLVSQQFQHVALTYDKASGVAALYRNGVKVAEANVGANLTARTTADLYLGKRLGGQSFNGILDELSVYRRALAAGEVAAIFNAGSAGKCNNQGAPPLITQQPANVTVTEGQTATFTAQASGSAPLTYQWKFGGTNILGATSSSLVLSNVTLSQAGNYSVFVANPFGTVLSSNALLSVNPITLACVPAPSNLVAWWKGEDNTLDAAGANNGVPVGTVTYTLGKVGRGFAYNAGSGYVQVPANPALNVGQSDGFTLEGWINPSSAPTQMPIFEWGTPGSGVGLQFWTSSYGSANLFANIVDSAGVDHLLYSSNNVLVSQQFQHVAVTFDKATGLASLYRNGIKIAETNFGPGLVARTSAELYLGKRIGGQSFSGTLDELSIYNRALQGSELAAIYSAGNGGKCDLPPTPPFITQQPLSRSVSEAGVAQFGVGVSGSQPMTFQWRFGGANILGANQSSLTLSNVAVAQAGPYDVVVANNYGSVTSAVAILSVDRLRILQIGAVPAQQEGTTITLPLNLISTGDVAGIDFKITYDTNYLRAPGLVWDKSVKRAFTDLNTNVPGEIRGALVLAGETVPSGVQQIAGISFFLRSVPSNLVTRVGLQILDMSGEAGDTLGGTLAQGTNVTIMVRTILGDNNANNRLDVGDATAILRYLTGLEQTRPWDITLNNLNGNTSIDSGDAIKALRASALLDAQAFTNVLSAKSFSSVAGAKSLNSVAGNAVLYPAALKSQPGQLVTVEVRLQNITYPVAGASFSLNYDTNALRLVDSSSYQFGSLVPNGALALWNIAPSQNNFATQSGLASMAASTASTWSSSNGTLAQLTFQVQPGASSQYQWPITLTSVEATEDGYINHQLTTAGSSLSVRPPAAASLVPAAKLVNGQFSLTVNGDNGVSYVVEASTDLVNWTPITTVAPANGSAVVTDPDAGSLPRRFYRVRLNQ